MVHSGEIYRHFKGNVYEVVAVGRHSETLEQYVVYRALSGDGEVWIRPLIMFTEQIQQGDALIPRFKKITPER